MLNPKISGDPENLSSGVSGLLFAFGRPGHAFGRHGGVFRRHVRAHGNFSQNPMLGFRNFERRIGRSSENHLQGEMKMAEKWVQHIGDDQLIYGMPKHMSSVASKSSPVSEDTKGYYWTVHPKPNACVKCKAMAGLKYTSEPKRPHPNCKCEIKKHYIGVSIMGKLDGAGSRETHTFNAGQKIEVEVQNLGPFAAGARIQVDDDVWESPGFIRPGQSETFEFTKFGEIPLPWKVMVMYDGGDNSSILYFV